MAKPKPPSDPIDLNAEGMSASDAHPSDTPTAESLPASERAPEVVKNRALGWKRNTPDDRDHSARPMLGAPTSIPAEYFGLLAFVVAAMDQSSSSACVGFALAAALMIRLRMLGIFAGDVSALAIYAWARMMGKLTKDEKLVDEGSMPRVAMQSLRSQGVPLEADWPFDLTKVNDELPWDVQQKASAGRVTQWFRLDSDGAGLLHDIMHALVQDFPVVFGTFVDTKFMSLPIAETFDKAPVVKSMNLRDARGGGHMMCIVAYRTNSDGRIEFLVLNSWGLAWGYRGMAWLDQDVILDSESGDFHVMQVTTTGNAKPEKEKAAA